MNQNNNYKQPILYVFRGLPGAGKTFRARLKGCLVIDPIDMYCTCGGVYDYSKDKEEQALLFAKRLMLICAEKQVDMAVAEVLPKIKDVLNLVYIFMEYAGYKIVVRDLIITKEQSIERNKHNVAIEDIDRMVADFEPWDDKYLRVRNENN